jgi:fatty acid synthase subunit alpha
MEVRVLLSVKLKLPLDGVTNDSTINKLVGGKSALQNEIVADLEKEFGSSPKSAAEMTVAELGLTLKAGYKALGPLSEGMVNKLISQMMPGGVGQTVTKLQFVFRSAWGAGC